MLVSDHVLRLLKSRYVESLPQVELSQFPYTLDQIKVVGIDVRSRGTVQPRLCVASEVMDAQAQ